MNLRTVLVGLLLTFALVALGASGALALLTTLLQQSSVQLEDSVESVRLAQGAVELLLLYDRAEPAMRPELADRLLSHLAEMHPFVSSSEEAMALDRAEEAVARYFDETDKVADFDLAFSILDELAAVNTAQASAARSAVAQWTQLGRATAIGAAAGLFCLLLAALLLVDRALRPIFALSATMDRFARGDRAARAREGGLAEVREMSTRFNQMATALDRQRQAQGAYLAGVAHELRTPLSAMAAAARVVRSLRADPSDPAGSMADLVQRQVAHLSRILGDLLDTARVESGQIELDLCECDLRSVASEVIELFEPACTIHRLSLQLPDSPVRVRCDRTRIEQVLINLVSNAIKYSPQGGNVSLRVEVQEQRALVSVTDEGVGIPLEDQSAVFEPFRRGKREGPQVPGVGMGLFVARRMVEAHGGELTLTSEPGRGSTFQVALLLS